jgi:hypothetical protein
MSKVWYNPKYKQEPLPNSLSKPSLPVNSDLIELETYHDTDTATNCDDYADERELLEDDKSDEPELVSGDQRRWPCIKKEYREWYMWRCILNKVDDMTSLRVLFAWMFIVLDNLREGGLQMGDLELD